ncbi:endonuclease [Labilibaculum filiforme]|uniref:Endonuclease n=2 Tax=Labilibaculum filiforme TaxID=1940526 RepID=A0A2N3I2K7_9BACT|nr:endonuclease [Labilibaculum filiforme]
MKGGYIYILSNKNRTTLYIGVTSDLDRRIAEHVEGEGSKFSSKYNLTDLVYFEEFDDIGDAISREKKLKNWKREWKMNLIKSLNPELKDLKMDFR